MIADRRRCGMGVQMLDIGRRDVGLCQSDIHRAPGAVAVLATGCHVERIGRRAVADQFGDRLRAARQGMIQFLEHHDAGAFAHDEAVAVAIERTRGALRIGDEVGGERASGGEAAEADAVDTGFGTPGDGDIRFAGANEACRIADRLHAGGAGCHGRAEAAFEAVADRDVASREIDQERGHGERRQPADALGIGGADRVGNCRKAADAGGDDRRRALAFSRILRQPAGLRDGFIGSHQRKQDEAIHLLLILARRRLVRIETAFRIIARCRVPDRRPWRRDQRSWPPATGEDRIDLRATGTS